MPVHRESTEAATALREAVAALDGGRCVAIYPEGTLTRDPELWPMRGKTGAARLALESRHPVIPVAQWGPQEVIPEYAHVPKLFPRKTIHIRFGPPVELDDLYGPRPTMEAVMEATDRIMGAITRELEEIRGERAPAVRFDPKAHGMAVTGNFKQKKKRRSALRGGQR